MDFEKQTRYWLMFLIVTAIGIFLVISLNNYSKNTCPPSQTGSASRTGNVHKDARRKHTSAQPDKKHDVVKEYQQGLTTITDLSSEPNQARFKYEYRIWPKRDFLDPDNYAFYSMYGWQTSPPYEYPQKTIDTVYDEVMRNCACSPSEGNEQCYETCRFNALRASGFPSIFKN